MMRLKGCIALMCMLCLVACEPGKKPAEADAGTPAAKAPTPEADAGAGAKAAESQTTPDMAQPEPQDAVDTGAPLELKLDDTLMPATKSGIMPRFNSEPGQLNSPLGQPGKKNLLPTKK